MIKALRLSNCHYIVTIGRLDSTLVIMHAFYLESSVLVFQFDEMRLLFYFNDKLIPFLFLLS